MWVFYPSRRVVGIVGRNGADKSTLLQMVCGTLAFLPVARQWRVAALLELGRTSPDFWDRENIYITYAILGLSQPGGSASGAVLRSQILRFHSPAVKTLFQRHVQLRLAFAFSKPAWNPTPRH